MRLIAARIIPTPPNNIHDNLALEFDQEFRPAGRPVVALPPSLAASAIMAIAFASCGQPQQWGEFLGVEAVIDVIKTIAAGFNLKVTIER